MSLSDISFGLCMSKIQEFDTEIKSPVNILCEDDANTFSYELDDCHIIAYNFDADCSFNVLVDSTFNPSDCIANDILNTFECKLIDSGINSYDLISCNIPIAKGYMFAVISHQISGNDNPLLGSGGPGETFLCVNKHVLLNSSGTVMLKNDDSCNYDSALQEIYEGKESSKVENCLQSNCCKVPLIDNEFIHSETLFITDKTDFNLFCSSLGADGESVYTDLYLSADINVFQFVLKFSKMCFTANSLLTKGLENIQHYISLQIILIYQEKDNHSINHETSLIKIGSDLVQANEKLNFLIIFFMIFGQFCILVTGNI